MKKILKRLFVITLCLIICMFNVVSVSATSDSEKTNVIFNSKVEGEVNGDLYINAMNVKTKESNFVVLYQYNDYIAYSYLPEGEYRIVEGGKMNDYTNYMKVECIYFTVKGDNTIVDLNFGPNILNNVTEAQNEKPQEITDNAEKEIKDKLVWWHVVGWCSLIILIIAGVFFGRKLYIRLK